MEIFETGPKPLPQDRILYNESFLWNNSILEGTIDPNLRRFGLLRVTSGGPGYREDQKVYRMRDHGLPIDAGLFFWSAKLLDLEPEKYRARVDESSGRFVRVGLVDQGGRYLGNITAKALRIVEGMSSGIVGESGYLIGEGGYARDQDFLDAKRGQKPEMLDNSSFVEVLANPGKRVMLVRFGRFIHNEAFVEDAVVIDPETRQLVPRVVNYPLAYERWGVPIPRGISSIQNLKIS